MNREEKTSQVEALKGVFTGSGVVVIARNAGLDVAQMTALRGRLAGVGATMKVVKNRLAKIALAGNPAESAGMWFSGPVAIVFGADAVGAAKTAADFAKENEKFVLLGAMFGPQVLDSAGVASLAALPSLDELRGKIIGLLNAPATKLAGVLQAPAGQLARVLKAYAEKDHAA